MKNKLYLFFLSLIFVGCTEPFNIKTNDSEPTIVIYGVLTDEFKQQSVQITRSSPYFDNEPNPAISGAKVTIKSSDGKEFELFEDTENAGNYLSKNNWSAQSGINYTLNVDVDFKKNGTINNYQASTLFAPTAFFDSLKIVPMMIMGHANYALNVYGQDSEEEEFYLFRITINDSLATTALSQYILTDDILFNGQYIDGLTMQYFDDISEWENDSEEVRERSTYIKYGDKIDVELSIITKGYYDFITQCVREMGGENPMFGGPASNITTNISNGGVGFFTGYCSSKVSATVENSFP